MTEVVPGTLALRRGGGKAWHSLVSGGGAFFHLRREYFLVSGGGAFFHLRYGASADQTAAAVGSQNVCPPGAVLQPFRGRRQFEYAVRHTFPAKSRPLEAILYVHRPRSRKCLAFVSENALPPELLCLTNCPASGTAPLPELSRFRNCLRAHELPLRRNCRAHELPRLRQGNCQKRALILQLLRLDKFPGGCAVPLRF